MIKDTRLSSIGVGNIKGSYFGPAPILNYDPLPSSQDINKDYYYDINGRKHLKSEKPKELTDNTSKILESSLFDTLNRNAQLYCNYDLYNPFIQYINEDGDLTPNEFRAGLELLSSHLENWQLEEISKLYDKNYNGKINIYTFYLSYFSRRQKREWLNLQSNIERILKQNEKTTKLEFKRKLRTMDIHIPDYEYKQLLSIIEKENDGLINNNDFFRILNVNVFLLSDNTSLLNSDKLLTLNTNRRKNDEIYENAKKEIESYKLKQEEVEKLYMNIKE